MDPKRQVLGETLFEEAVTVIDGLNLRSCSVSRGCKQVLTFAAQVRWVLASANIVPCPFCV